MSNENLMAQFLEMAEDGAQVQEVQGVRAQFFDIKAKALCGYFLGEYTLKDKDGNDVISERNGEPVTAWEFEEAGTADRVLLNKQKALESLSQDQELGRYLYYIEFKGKIELENGNSFNTYKINKVKARVPCTDLRRS